MKIDELVNSRHKEFYEEEIILDRDFVSLYSVQPVHPTEYREANSQASSVLPFCSTMANSIGIPIEDSQEDGNLHSRL
jgi:hypothetical protein